jgi:hypothetical protein
LSCSIFFFGGFLVTPFILILQTRFNVSSSMFFSIYKIFKFKWWYLDHLAIFNIVTCFINDFLKWAPLLHLAFVMVLLWFRTTTTNEKCEMQCLHFYTNHNLQK